MNIKINKMGKVVNLKNIDQYYFKLKYFTKLEVLNKYIYGCQKSRILNSDVG